MPLNTQYTNKPLRCAHVLVTYTAQCMYLVSRVAPVGGSNNSGARYEAVQFVAASSATRSACVHKEAYELCEATAVPGKCCNLHLFYFESTLLPSEQNRNQLSKVHRGPRLVRSEQ